VWISDMGDVTEDVPQLHSIQNVGYVVNSTTIFVDIKSPILFVAYNQECFVPSSTPTPTVTPTPSAQ
jgi:hypothetical protein